MKSSITISFKEDVESSVLDPGTNELEINVTDFACNNQAVINKISFSKIEAEIHLNLSLKLPLVNYNVKRGILIQLPLFP